MTAGLGLRTLGQAAVFLIVARVLGVEAYGAYAAVLALAMTFGGGAGFGASYIMMRDTARDGTVFTESWGRTLSALLFTAPPIFLAYVLLAWAVLPKQFAWSVVICVGVTEIVLSPLILTVMQAFQGHDRIGRAARVVVAQILPRIAAALLMLPLGMVLSEPMRLPIWSLLYMLSAGFAAVYAMRLLGRDLGVGIELHRDGLRHAIREGWPFSVTGMTQKVYVDIDKVMLARLSSLETTGAYSAAYRVVEMAGVPLLSFFSAASPRFFRAGHHGTRSAARYVLHVLPLPMAYALAVGVAIYIFAWLLPMALGPGFAPAIEMLHWLAWLPLLSTPRRFMQAAFEASDRQRNNAIVVAFGAVLNIVLNLCAIPLWGWRGAVGATYVAELLMNGLFLILAIWSWRRV